MRKSFIACLLLLSAAGVKAQNISLVFRSADGTEQAIETSGLEMVFDGGLLRATSATMSLSLPLSDLRSMEFSSIAAGVDAVHADNAAGPVDIYDPDGRCIGTAVSVSEAASALPAGIYIIKSSEGNARKIAVRK
ncbi:MAG: hypothetical protein K2L21_01705 [Muribaculaceae bacterium]|nr:hypothetical protein [Muribaculaceae bacterium]